LREAIKTERSREIKREKEIEKERELIII